MCERSGATAADESRVPEPAVAAQEFGGAAPQPPASDQPPEARPGVEAPPADSSSRSSSRNSSRSSLSRSSSRNSGRSSRCSGAASAARRVTFGRTAVLVIEPNTRGEQQRAELRADRVTARGWRFLDGEADDDDEPAAKQADGVAPAAPPAVAPAAGVMRGAPAGGDEGEGSLHVSPLEGESLDLNAPCHSSASAAALAAKAKRSGRISRSHSSKAAASQGATGVTCKRGAPAGRGEGGDGRRQPAPRRAPAAVSEAGVKRGAPAVRGECDGRHQPARHHERSC